MTDTKTPSPSVLASLRHLYQNMVNGGVRDTASSKRIAEGLLAPAIEALERGAQPAGEPVAWMWQHDETGRTGFVDCWQVENGWQVNNPRLKLVRPLVFGDTAPQPAPVRDPQPMPDLTQLTERGAEAWAGVDAQALREGGITGGQHGAE
ncbi:hypothetical protein C380_08545 [Acidovorax sp. KKS102]|uniref:hypothetical protein n=1 Tax=Acidovorax sp. KKS102 TaxID=358220 RepID=UPI00028B99A6|nr:hypothetical protein [Acidovorax sp. KKS102]AFU45411.1 hypothetical protein C380_08545 [Acidovorax sp. KKS102]